MIELINVCKDYRTHNGTRRILDNVNVAIHRGMKIGVLGRNGAGKSTLIRVMAGVEPPSTGEIRQTMTLSWPLGLSGGFQGSLTGDDNLRFISRLYGKNIQDVRDYVDDFAELGKQLKMPVKTYSAGMRARLAFGLSLAIEFDCYLIDEVILVGDQRFQNKCRIEIFEKRADRALILASHDHGVVREYCDSCMVLRAGRAKVFKDVNLALDIYNDL